MTRERGPYACLDCRHLILYEGCRGYGPMTPPEPMEWRCGKGMYEQWTGYDIDAQKIRSVLEIGANCDVYEPKEEE